MLPQALGAPKGASKLTSWQRPLQLLSSCDWVLCASRGLAAGVRGPPWLDLCFTSRPGHAILGCTCLPRACIYPRACPLQTQQRRMVPTAGLLSKSFLLSPGVLGHAQEVPFAIENVVHRTHTLPLAMFGVDQEKYMRSCMRSRHMCSNTVVTAR